MTHTATGRERIYEAFGLAKVRGEGALVAYLCAGDPDRETSAALLRAVGDAGCDIIEVGIPYGDPLADGPTIAASAQRALDAGMTIAGALELVRGAAAASGPPSIAFTYFNPVLQFGIEQFADMLVRAGACGAIVPDIPLEESGRLREVFGPRGLALPLLIAPTTPPERAREIARASDGFIYVVSRLGVTSARTQPDFDWIAERVADLRTVSGLPIAIGFGISSAGHVRRAWDIADGAIVGSALIDAISRGADPVEAASAFLRGLRPAMNARDGWPALEYATYAETAEHLHRLAQIGGKYQLFAPYSIGFGSVTMPVTARGFATQTLYANGVTFEIRYDVLDDRVTIASDRGSRALPLQAGSIAGFYTQFCETAAALGLPPLKTTILPEIAGAPHLDTDTEMRPYDPMAARAIWRAFARVSHALAAWQAAYRGHRPPVGIMFGGFDLFAPRFLPAWKTPPTGKPAFMQNSETADYVAVGFALGDDERPAPYFFAYATPPSPEFARADFVVHGAAFSDEAGLAILPYADVVAADDPYATVLDFADAVYAAARQTHDLPNDLERRDGWHAATTLVSPVP